MLVRSTPSPNFASENQISLCGPSTMQMSIEASFGTNITAMAPGRVFDRKSGSQS